MLVKQIPTVKLLKYDWDDVSLGQVLAMDP